MIIAIDFTFNPIKERKLIKMQTSEDYKDMELIKTIDSERYGNHVDWKENLNMSYVNEFEIINGKDRDRFIKRQIENTQWHWEDTIPRELDILFKINESLQLSRKYVDTQEIIRQWISAGNNKEVLLQLLNALKGLKI